MPADRSAPRTCFLALSLVAPCLLGWGVLSTAAAAPAAAQREQLMINGSAADDDFSRVAGAGDINGDGFADIIVGAPFNDQAGANAGVARIYFGSPGMDNVADVTLLGAAAGDNFGTSVAGAGDVNGDGYADVIVGATAAGGTGRAYLFFGGPAMDAVADLTLSAAAAGDNYGNSVAGAGDLNRDGFADLIVGAPFNDTFGPDAGRVYIYFGGGIPDAAVDVILTATSLTERFGTTVAGAGDFNGDGFADVIVGAPLNDVVAADAGRAYVFFGGNAPNNVVDVTLSGEGAAQQFGVVAGAGDVNGDGFADVIVSAIGVSTGTSSAGRAYVYYGGAVPDAAADWILNSTGNDDLFGVSVARAGDVNADGYADVIVGSTLSDANGTDSGRALLFYGGPAGNDALPDHVWNGASGDQFGYRVAGAGDVNGDQFDDVLVGVRLSDTPGPNSGRFHLFDFNRYFLGAPNGGETWNVGANQTITWRGAQPADLWLSLDGGASYEILASDVGGSSLNAVSLRVPHAPTKFAMIRMAPVDPAVVGSDASDNFFTILSSISLLNFTATLDGGDAELAWASDPGPEDLTGYRVERAEGPGYRTIVSLTRETRARDPQAPAGARYRLFAVNGLGEEVLLGETSLALARPLAAWPLPYRGGDLQVSFATTSALGGDASPAEVAIFDLTGRRVRTLARGVFQAGRQQTVWDGRDAAGRKVSDGLYFLRLSTGAERRNLRLVVLP